MEPTTTTDNLDNQPGAEAQPAEAQAQPAEATTTETHPDQQSGETTDESLEWLRNKGIDPNDPDALKKAAVMSRKAEQEFHKNRQESKVLEKQVISGVDTGNEFLDKLHVIEAQQQILAFKMNPKYRDFGDYEQEMTKISQDEGIYNLEALYHMAKGRNIDLSETYEAKGREAAKAALARSSAAKSPSSNANMATPTSKDSALDAFDEAFLSG